MASIGDVAAALRAAVATAEEAAGQVRAADERVETALGPLQAALSDSANHNAHDGLGSLSSVRERLAEALAALKAGTDRMSEYIAAIASGGGSGPPATGGRASGSGFDSRRRDPAKAAAVRRFGWPRRPDGKTSARGLLYDGSGKQVLHAPLRALKSGQVYNTPDLKPEWRRPEMKTSWHIEGGAAAYMRSTETKEMSLWLNLPACGDYGPFADPDPNGCDANLPKILPRGYTLRVHTEYEHGGARVKTYRGTGEALKDD